MKKSVGRITMRMAIFAIAVTWTGSAKAASVQDVLDQLYGVGNTSAYSEINANARTNWLKTGDVTLNILESTVNTTFGFKRAGTESALVYGQVPTSGPGADPGFRVFGRTSDDQLLIDPNPPLKTLQTTRTDTAVDSAADLGGNVIGLGSFQFLLRTGTTFNFAPTTPPNTSATPTNGPYVFTSAGESFRAFSVHVGDYAGGYIIAFEGTDDAGKGFTFVSSVTGVVNPEPASMAMLGMGVIGLVGYRARRRLKAAAAV